MRLSDILAILVIMAVLLATMYVSQARGIEAAGLYNEIASLKTQISNLTPVPQIHVARAAIYPMSGEVVVEKVK